jgi:NADPH-ferrihemoprotein reductase
LQIASIAHRLCLLQEELQRLATIDNHLAVFFLATYGEGDPTDNAQDFYEWLHGDGRELAKLNYGVSATVCWKRADDNGHFLCQVFGLGNKTYEHYNAVGKYVDKRLTELGGLRVCELGLGDDDGK